MSSSNNPRVIWHRPGALSVPGDVADEAFDNTSTLSAVSAGTESNCLHVFVACEDGSQNAVLGPMDSPAWTAESSLVALAQQHAGVKFASVDGKRVGFSSSQHFQATAVDELRQRLEKCGRSLKVLVAPSVKAAGTAVLEFAASNGAGEVHTVASRDIWQTELDNLAKTAMSAKGVAFVLHDSSCLVAPHRMNLAIVAAEGSEVLDSALAGLASALPGTSGGNSGSGELSGRNSTPSPNRSRRDSGNTVSESSLHAIGVDNDPSTLPTHVRSLLIFTHALQWYMDGGHGGQQQGGKAGVPAATSSAEQVLADNTAARQLLSPGPSPACLVESDQLLSELGGSLSHQSVLLTILASHVRRECCAGTGDLTFAAKHSLYCRSMSAPPVVQALVSCGLWSARTAWRAAHAIVDACKAVLGQRAVGAAGSSSSTVTAESAVSASHSSSVGVGGHGEGAQGAAASAAGHGSAAEHRQALQFLLEYASRVVRWVTIREYCSHLAYYRPQLVYGPGRAELSVLPWTALPAKLPNTGSKQLPGAGGNAGGSRSGTPTRHAAAPAPAPAPAPAQSSSWWGSGWGSSASAAATPAAPAEHPHTALVKQLKAAYAEDASDAHVLAFVAGCTGYPLADAALRCLRGRGYIPPMLLPVLAVLWCKHMGKPWHEGARWMAGVDVTADPCVSAMAWQWCTGMSGGQPWAVPVGAPEALCGVWAHNRGGCPPISSPGKGYADSDVTDLQLLLRYHPLVSSHPHSMASPVAWEFAYQPDPAGLFVRAWCGAKGEGAGNAWLQPLHLPLLPAAVPDGFIYEPQLAPGPVCTAAGLRLLPWSDCLPGRGKGGKSVGQQGVYPAPFTALGKVRERTIEAVIACHSHVAAMRAKGSSLFPHIVVPTLSELSHMFGAAAQAAAATMSAAATLSSSGKSSWTKGLFFSSNVGAGADSGAGASRPDLDGHGHGTYLSTGGGGLLDGLEATAAGAATASKESGIDMSWGLSQGGSYPVLVEEDTHVFLAQACLRKEDGWSEVVDDSARALKAYMADRGNSGVRVCLANVVMKHAPEEVYDAIATIRRYSSWDLTWFSMRELGKLDGCNRPCHMIADAPPPPYSYVITQRDFVISRHCVRLVGPGIGVVYFRNSAHAHHPGTTMTYIRGEVQGVSGFMVRTLQLPEQCRVATSVSGETARMSDAVVAASVPSSPAPGAQVQSGGQLVAPSYPGGACQMIMTACGDPKGSIPSYLINFVAKRTPRMWVDRLTKHCNTWKG